MERKFDVRIDQIIEGTGESNPLFAGAGSGETELEALADAEDKAKRWSAVGALTGRSYILKGQPRLVTESGSIPNHEYLLTASVEGLSYVAEVK